MLAIPARVIATCFALTSFAATVVMSYVNGNPAPDTVFWATVVMMSCWFVGRIVGTFAQKTVDDYIARYRRAYPIPKEPDVSAQHDDSQQPLESTESMNAPEDVSASPVSAAA